MSRAISVENLGKRYRGTHGGRRAHYATLREGLTHLLTLPLRRWRGHGAAGPRPEFWALKDVSFEVGVGEAVGVIGHNGAGKSTLLKILSRITKPTVGQVRLHGRVGSLLEAGTGFHSELTGRENVYLNASILGMSRREIQRKFDPIVAFSGVERFLDLPIKRYSSGMQVRLAFAVAAHLEPEILVIDEVLAVGDAQFQRRCIERMAELGKNGCTLLFISHNMDVIPKVCTTAILLKQGRLVMRGAARDVIETYLTQSRDDPHAGLLSDKGHRGDGRARFERLAVLDAAGRPAASLHSGTDLRLVVQVRSTAAMNGVSLGIVLRSIQGTRLITGSTDEVGYRVNLKAGWQSFECRFQEVRLRPGRQIAVELWMADGDEIDHVDCATVLDVIEASPTHFSNGEDQGALLCDYTWSQCE